MIPIIDLLNKIKWDKKEKPEDYEIIYFDRILGKQMTIPYTKIQSLEDPFIVLRDKAGETRIPLHRIKEVKKKDKSIWKR